MINTLLFVSILPIHRLPILIHTLTRLSLSTIASSNLWYSTIQLRSEDNATFSDYPNLPSNSYDVCKPTSPISKAPVFSCSISLSFAFHIILSLSLTIIIMINPIILLLPRFIPRMPCIIHRQTLPLRPTQYTHDCLGYTLCRHDGPPIFP